jgi:hypothetical protein
MLNYEYFFSFFELDVEVAAHKLWHFLKIHVKEVKFAVVDIVF